MHTVKILAFPIKSEGIPKISLAYFNMHFEEEGKRTNIEQLIIIRFRHLYALEIDSFIRDILLRSHTVRKSRFRVKQSFEAFPAILSTTFPLLFYGN